MLFFPNGGKMKDGTLSLRAHRITKYPPGLISLKLGVLLSRSTRCYTEILVSLTTKNSPSRPLNTTA